jgi:hypothetical protein
MAKWTTEYVDNLPDSAFLYVEAGGTKEDGKTKPRSLRHFEYKDDEDKVDLPHVRDAIGRIPQSNAPGLSAEHKKELQDKCREILKAHGGMQARNALCEPAQGNFEPLRAGKFRKDVLRTGAWHLPGGKILRATPSRMDGWIAKFNEMRDAGIQITAPADHSDDSKDNMGFVEGLEREGDTLFTILDVPREEDQSRIGTTIREVSVEVTPHFVDGSGKDWGEVISHISPCTKPVVFGQANFVPLAARGEGGEDVEVFQCRKDTNSMDLKGEICKLCGLEDDASEEQILQAVKTKLGKHTTQMRQAKEERDQAVTRCSQLEETVKQLRAGGAGDDEEKEESPEVIALRQDVERMISEGAEAKVLQLRAEGKVVPAMEPAVRALLTQRRTKIQLRLKDGEKQDSDIASQVETIFSVLPKGAALDLTERTKLRALDNPNVDKEPDQAALVKSGQDAAARAQAHLVKK